MSLKNKFEKFIDYFTEDGEEVTPNVTELKPEKTLTSVSAPKEELPQAQESLRAFMLASKNWR